MGWFIPQASSTSRLYVPMGFISKDIVISDPNFVLYNADLWECALLNSKMHMVWIRSVAGTLGTSLRYSSSLVYNTFPIPNLSPKKKKELSDLILNIIDIRDEEGGSYSNLYGAPLSLINKKNMNQRLLGAHLKLDNIVDKYYKQSGFKTDDERLSLLLDMYSKKIKEEN
ncbi:hypothetical protein MUB42_00210 [Apilactobacillus kunkeei]|nr:hypothetical protein MUB42_00210 [Apilactobacillus kunkeei]